MTLQKFVPDVDYFKDTEKFYETAAKKIGIDELRKCLPVYDDETILRAYNQPNKFASIPLSKWDAAAGYRFVTNHSTQSQTVIPFDTPLKRLLHENGINAFSPSECVCILKAAAKLIAERIKKNE